MESFIDFYKADMPNIEGLDAELDMLETRWLKKARELRELGSKHTVPKRIADTLLYSLDKDFHPNITTILYTHTSHLSSHNMYV